MISDLLKLATVINAVTDPPSGVDLVELEDQVRHLSSEEREKLRHALTEGGTARLAFNGQAISLRLRDRVETNT